MKSMKSISLAWIIHIFALLHAIVALCCRYTGIDDQLLLTVLTMTMSLIICMKMGVKVGFTAAIIIVVNILGYLLGTFGANMLQSFLSSEYVVHSLSTMITTEILGWCNIGMTKIFGQRSDKEERSVPYMKWLLLIASGIFILRLLIVFLFSRSPIEQDSIFEITHRVMSNTFAMIILICVNVLFIRTIATREKPESRYSTIALYITFMLLATMLEAFLVGTEGFDLRLVLIVAFLAQITVYCLVYMINFALTARSEMHAQREKANMAQYRYLKLKRQVNPHFLFNSLNILDCLICDDKPDLASLYTHKLAGIYRYMIKSEEEEIVSLRDELVFVNLYVDLLKVRFPEGFEVEIDVPEEKMARFVPPCSIQLLIENATKHNTVSEDTPLIIRVEANEKGIQVSNNIIPKITSSESTGLGQKYIRQLYLDLSGKEIFIENSNGNYCVTLPLL